MTKSSLRGANVQIRINANVGKCVKNFQQFKWRTGVTCTVAGVGFFRSIILWCLLVCVSFEVAKFRIWISRVRDKVERFNG